MHVFFVIKLTTRGLRTKFVIAGILLLFGLLLRSFDVHDYFEQCVKAAVNFKNN
jgi:hypothetical protein